MNIFQISDELTSVFDELEENGGELTPELEEKLSISQEQLDSKISNYLGVIKQLESDSDLCDKEIKRLQTIKKSKQNTIAKLKSILCYTVDKFGQPNKSGNNVIDLGTCKLTAKASEQVSVDETYYNEVVENIFNLLNDANYTKELNDNPITELLSGWDDVSKGIRATISVEIPLEDLFASKGEQFIKEVFNYDAGFKVKPTISKTLLKDKLKENPNAYKFATIKSNKTVLIK